jgi:hypothetical protein
MKSGIEKDAVYQRVRSQKIRRTMLRNGDEQDMSNLAFTWKRQGQDKEALKLMEEYVTLQTMIIGTNHPHTSSSRKILLGWQTYRPYSRQGFQSMGGVVCSGQRQVL